MTENIKSRPRDVKAGIRRAQERVRRYIPEGVSLSDELIAERRAEARREDEGDKAMTLEMRPVCEKCEAGLGHDAEAFICSFECTFCGPCTEAMDSICPNCGGELVRRPKRTKKD